MRSGVTFYLFRCYTFELNPDKDVHSWQDARTLCQVQYLLYVAHTYIRCTVVFWYKFIWQAVRSGRRLIMYLMALIYVYKLKELRIFKWYATLLRH
jgi:hypothetical protein